MQWNQHAMRANLDLNDELRSKVSKKQLWDLAAFLEVQSTLLFLNTLFVSKSVQNLSTSKSSTMERREALQNPKKKDVYTLYTSFARLSRFA